jgi:hypothetical protein
VKHAALNPFRGYANAIRVAWRTRSRCWTPSTPVKLGTQVVDKVRRRVQQDTVGHRGHKADPLYKIRRLLRHGVEHLTPRQVARLDASLVAGDPTWEVTVTWQAYQQLRAIYHAAHPGEGRRRAERVIEPLHSCPIPEVSRLGRTLRAWRTQALAYFQSGRLQQRDRGRQRRHRKDPAASRMVTQLQQLHAAPAAGRMAGLRPKRTLRRTAQASALVIVRRDGGHGANTTTTSAGVQRLAPGPWWRARRPRTQGVRS